MGKATTAKARTAPGDRVAPVLTGINSSLSMPERINKRGSATSYPFADLAVGQSFGVKNKNAKQISSIVSNQNRKPGAPKVDASGAPVYKMVEVKDANGVVTGHIPSKDRETDEENKKHFFAVDCDPKKDPEGASVRVWRDK
jgi:hypothetical protein